MDTGLFRFTKVWVEPSLLLELLSPDQAPAYVACFGAEGAPHLDARLRDLERALRNPARGSAFPRDRVGDDGP